MRTMIGVGDPQVVKKWFNALGVAVNEASYFARKMMGYGQESRLPIQRMDELESDAGDEVTYDLLMPMNTTATVHNPAADAYLADSTVERRLGMKVTAAAATYSAPSVPGTVFVALRG